MRKIAILIVTGALLLLGATPVYAVPALPHAFYGSVTVNGAPASNGTQVSATGTGVTTGIPQNPVTTTVAGEYGSDGLYLLVQGDISNGATVTFYVNGVSTGQTATFETGGGPTEMNLSVTITGGDGDGGGGGGAPPPGPTTVEASLFGGTVEFGIDNQGVIQETVEATSEDGNLTITIDEGTIALDVDGNPLSSLTSDVDVSPPDPPEDANIIGLAYDFGPDGTTFDPPITFTWTYDPDALPEGVAEENLVIAYYDEVAGEWVELDSVVDTENNTITASVSHLTTFAIIGAVTPPLPPPAPAPAVFSVSNLSVQPAEVQPKEAVTITVSVANTGGTEGSYTVVLKLNGLKEAEKSVTIAAGRSEIVTFSVTREEADSYTVAVDGLSASFIVVAPSLPAPPTPPAPTPTPEKPFNWPLIGGIIAAGVVVGLGVFFWMRRRAA